MVPKKDGGQRPVINLKHLNRFVKSEHFKMEGLHTVKALIQKNNWLAKVDLKDAFFMVPIAQQHQHLLLFTVGTKTFQFKCLPFKLCTDPRVFTKVLKLAIELLRAIDIRLVIYMDNMLIMAHSNQMFREQIYQVLFLIENLGFIINSKKSLLSSTQEIKFFGMIVNSQTMEIKLPGQKIKTIRLEARQMLDHSQPTAGATPLELKWEEPNLPINHPDHNHQCLTPGLGSCLQRQENERIMVTPGTVTSHKLPGTSSSNLGDSDICQGQVRDTGNLEDGQHYSSCVHQQERRDCIPCSIRTSKEPVAMVHREKHPHSSSKFTRVNELHSRPRVESPPRQVRLEAGSYHLLEDSSPPGTSIHSPVCKSPVSSAAIVCQLETQPFSHGNRCLLHGLQSSR